MAQFNIDVDSGIVRISQFIYRIFPGMSQDTVFSRAFAVPVRIGEGLKESGTQIKHQTQISGSQVKPNKINPDIHASIRQEDSLGGLASCWTDQRFRTSATIQATTLYNGLQMF